MILYKKENMINLKINDLCIVTDFDRTLTLPTNSTSWAILSKSGVMPKEYVEERQHLFDKYRPIEIDTNLDYEYRVQQMNIWWEKHIELLVKYKLKESTVDEVSRDLTLMELRAGMKDFLKFTYENNIPVIIISSGIGNFIKKVLENNNCYYDNIYVIANKIKFENGVAVGVEDDIIVHSLNKNEAYLPDDVTKIINEKKQILLMGDQLEDIRMINKERRSNTLAIAFINKSTEKFQNNYKKVYDVFLSEDSTGDELKDLLSM